MKRIALAARSCALLFCQTLPMLGAAMGLGLGVGPSQAADTKIPMVTVALPKSADDPATAGSLGFDDVIYDEATKSILLPGGRSGNLYRIDATENKPTASVLAKGAPPHPAMALNIPSAAPKSAARNSTMPMAKAPKVASQPKKAAVGPGARRPRHARQA